MRSTPINVRTSYRGLSEDLREYTKMNGKRQQFDSSPLRQNLRDLDTEPSSGSRIQLEVKRGLEELKFHHDERSIAHDAIDAIERLSEGAS